MKIGTPNQKKNPKNPVKLCRIIDFCVAWKKGQFRSLRALSAALHTSLMMSFLRFHNFPLIKASEGIKFFAFYLKMFSSCLTFRNFLCNFAQDAVVIALAASYLALLESKIEMLKDLLCQLPVDLIACYLVWIFVTQQFCNWHL